MINPRVEIDLSKIMHNTLQIVNVCAGSNINVMGVTKVFCGDITIAKYMVAGGVRFLADSRIQNIIGLSETDIPKVLLRLPMKSEVEEVVKYADYSLNSEIGTIKRLSRECVRQGKTHKIILMVDLGDLREGVWYEHIDETVKDVVGLEGIELVGIGTNLTCYGGVIPSHKNLSILSNEAEIIRQKYKISLPIVSGGNSSSLHLVYSGEVPGGISNLRIGEAIVLGRETAFGNRIEGLYDDAFTLHGEIIEAKRKPSMPIGNVGMDAFGGTPQFVDRGNRDRAIIAIGRQDIDFQGMIPMDDNVKIVGASSDHLIVDITESGNRYSVGSEISFKVSYGCLLRCMTSPYVKKVYVHNIQY